MALRLGFDVGGTSTKVGVFSGADLKQDFIFPSDLDKLESQVKDVLLSQKEAVEFLGFSFAGQVNENKIISSPNVKGTKLLNTDFNAWAKAKFKIPAAIDNDLKCASLAEFLQDKTLNLGVIYIGTGLGAAFFDKDKILRGANNFAAELGHVPFKKSPFKCGCSNDTCVELFASGSALKRWCESHDYEFKTLQDLKNSKLHFVYEQFIEGFEHALLSFNAMFNPAKIILGGGVIEKNKWLVDIANEALSTKGFGAVRSSLAVLSSLDKLAPAFGAVNLCEFK